MDTARSEAHCSGQEIFRPPVSGYAAIPSLHFHSVKRRFAHEIAEVADFHAPVSTAVDAVVVYFKSTVIFPTIYGFSKKVPKTAKDN
jgi:hypothetical protein